MVEILREGSEYTYNKMIRFECEQCGCLFDANKNEYKYCGNQIEGDDWKMTCPYCKNTVYSNKKVGW